MKKINILIFSLLVFLPKIAFAHNENDNLNYYPELLMTLISLAGFVILLRTALKNDSEVRKMFFSFSVGTFLYSLAWFIKLLTGLTRMGNASFSELMFEIVSVLSIIVLIYSIYKADRFFNNFTCQLTDLSERNSNLTIKQKELDEINSLLDNTSQKTREKNKKIQNVLNDFYELMPQIKKLIKRAELRERCDALKVKIDSLNEDMKEK